MGDLFLVDGLLGRPPVFPAPAGAVMTRTRRTEAAFPATGTEAAPTLGDMTAAHALKVIES